MRRRVAQKVGVLRVRVLRNYMGPFARGVIEKESLGGSDWRMERGDVHKHCMFVFGTYIHIISFRTSYHSFEYNYYCNCSCNGVSPLPYVPCY